MDAISAVSGYGGASRRWAAYASYVSNLSAARYASLRRSQPETPVEPVSALRPVAADASVRVPVVELPTEADLNNASEHLARTRIVNEKDFNTLLMKSA